MLNCNCAYFLEITAYDTKINQDVSISMLHGLAHG